MFTDIPLLSAFVAQKWLLLHFWKIIHIFFTADISACLQQKKDKCNRYIRNCCIPFRCACWLTGDILLQNVFSLGFSCYDKSQWLPRNKIIDENLEHKWAVHYMELMRHFLLALLSLFSYILKFTNRIGQVRRCCNDSPAQELKLLRFSDYCSSSIH